jgi:hypothetical protein
MRQPNALPRFRPAKNLLAKNLLAKNLLRRRACERTNCTVPDEIIEIGRY